MGKYLSDLKFVAAMVGLWFLLSWTFGLIQGRTRNVTDDAIIVAMVIFAIIALIVYLIFYCRPRPKP